MPRRRGSLPPLVVDELHRIEWLLRAVADLKIAATLADRAESSECADELAAWVQAAFGVDLDAATEPDPGTPDLADLPNAVETVIEAARWRLLRVARAVSLAGRVS